MNFLIIGSGARETVIIKKLYNENNNIFCIGMNNNPDINKYSKKFTVIKNDNDITLKIKFMCDNEKIDIVIIGPEKYLEIGVADFLIKNNINVIGPTKELSKLETDKHFARELIASNFSIAKYNPKYKYFNNIGNNINQYYEICRAFNFDYVIKPVGLCSGKGVKLSKEHFENDMEAFLYAMELSSSNKPFLIEEKINGKEFSLMSYTDGEHFSHMPIVQDFKRLLDNDEGPNTGSMGCISYSNHKLPFLTEYDVIKCREINEEVIETLQRKVNQKYKGIVYGSFIKCNETGDIKIIEYNCRYGDPECINTIELLDSSLTDIYYSIINKTLKNLKVTYIKDNIVSKYIVPIDYAIPKKKILLDNTVINFNNNWITDNRQNIIFASVNLNKYILSTTNSRTFVYFKKSKDKINKISEDINSELFKLLERCNKTLRFRKDIGLIKTIDYKSSGVDIDKGNECVKAIKQHIRYTNNENVVSKIGDFSGMVSLKKYLNCFNGFMEPILVSSIDGVGTKTSFLYKIFKEEAFDIVGRDIVNHCVNDVLTKGAEPLFFLDYIASSKLEIKHVERIVKGISRQCKIHNCPLVGGETAEMPAVYHDDEIDVVGCMVGIIDKHEIIDGPELITTDDIIIGFPSNGIHTNGFSLIKKIHETYAIPHSILSWLKQPHKSYLNEIKYLKDANINIYGICHITGGGLIDNPPRILPENCKINLKKKYINKNNFAVIQDLANLSDDEMHRTFNCGIGMMIFVSKENFVEIKDIYTSNNVPFFLLGKVAPREINEPQVNFVNSIDFDL